VGAATVVRFATKLGFGGYGDLQASIRRDLIGRLRPAAERIRASGGVEEALARHAEVEAANVTDTVAAIDPDEIAEIVTRLADPDVAVHVVSGAASSGVAAQFTLDLGQLRPGVVAVSGNEVEVHRSLALAEPGDVLVALDLQRYDRWLLDAVRTASGRGVWIVALTDSVLSPLASLADRTIVVRAAATGPFDSHVGSLAVFDLLVAGVAGRDRDRAQERLERFEDAWSDRGALTDD
jgi:DNA-binding MurR/RpiR family transcriptional regulator